MAVKESADGVTFLRKLVPGAADSSYGIYCAQLAGLPEIIVLRAYTLLNEKGSFDTGNSPAMMETAVAYIQQPVPVRSSIEQLSMFVEAPHTAKPSKPTSSDKLLDKLRKLDVMRMTPMQALEWLNDARNQLKESGENR
jgi:DNA mismatch repair protein MutS